MQFLQSVGSSPVLIEMLNTSVTAGVMLVAVALSILAEIWSGPLDFDGSILLMRVNTSSSVQSKSAGHFSPSRIENSPISIGDAGVVNIFVKHSFNNWALLSSSSHPWLGLGLNLSFY